jgi:2-polyprenyl-3-methyl-5-hydroxy-6-metoxy-1,4-benzoquinol methylase
MANDITPEKILELSAAYRQSCVLFAAYQLDIFSTLTDGDKTSSDVAKALSTDERATDRLMNALVGMGLLIKQDGVFANTDVANQFLVKGKPDFMAGLGHSANLWTTWGTLADAVREGKAILGARMDERGEDRLRNFIEAMNWRASRSAAEVLANLDLSGVKQILDIGGGSGAYSFAFVNADENIKSTVFDVPDVIKLTNEYIQQAGLSDRVDTIPGDYNIDDFGAGYDLIYMSAIVHINSPEQNIALIRKAANALNPSGRIVISDFVVDDSRTSPPMGAFFALNMLVNTECGDTYTENEIREWFTDAGLTDINRIQLRRGISLMTGRKP